MLGSGAPLHASVSKIAPLALLCKEAGGWCTPEFVLVVDRCSEVQRWDLDPMLVEVDACLAKPQASLTSQAMSEVA
jgi:hypothetical protein